MLTDEQLENACVPVAAHYLNTLYKAKLNFWWDGAHALKMKIPRLWVQCLQGAGLFSTSLISNMSFNKSLEEVTVFPT